MSGFQASNLLAGTQQAVATAYKTLLALSASNGTSLQRIFVEEFVFGTDGTPADNVMTYDVSRISADGTSTSITPNKDDGAEGAFLGLVTGNHTVEPTVTAASSLWGMGMNQRATHRWVAPPDMKLVIPATNAAGLAFRVKSPGYTNTAVAQIAFRQ